MTLQKETLVPLDESDLIAHCERQEQKIAALTTENKRLKGVLRLMANAPLLETAPLQQVKAFIRKAQEALRDEEQYEKILHHPH